MRIIAQQWMSLDGFASGDPDEQAIFAHIPDATDSERHNVALLDSVDVVLLGRRTYESFSSVWPTLDHPMATYVNRVPKIVVSSTLERAPWGEHEPARVARGLDEIAPGGGTALVWGSLALMDALLAAGRLDELEVFVAPIVLGRGRPLFAPERTVGLQQTDGEIWRSGTTRVRYRVCNPSFPSLSVEI